MFYFHLYLGKIPILTHIFQMGGSTTNPNKNGGSFWMINPAYYKMMKLNFMAGQPTPP